MNLKENSNLTKMAKVLGKETKIIKMWPKSILSVPPFSDNDGRRLPPERRKTAAPLMNLLQKFKSEGTNREEKSEQP